MSHPIAQLFSNFTGAGLALVLLCMTAVKAETAARQWPWILAWALSLILLSAFVAGETFLADAYVARVCR